MRVIDLHTLDLRRTTLDQQIKETFQTPRNLKCRSRQTFKQGTKFTENEVPIQTKYRRSDEHNSHLYSVIYLHRHIVIHTRNNTRHNNTSAFSL